MNISYLRRKVHFLEKKKSYTDIRKLLSNQLLDSSKDKFLFTKKAEVIIEASKGYEWGLMRRKSEVKLKIPNYLEPGLSGLLESDFLEVERLINRALDIDEFYSPALIIKGDILLRRKQFFEAEKIFTDCFKIKDSKLDEDFYKKNLQLKLYLLKPRKDIFRYLETVYERTGMVWCQLVLGNISAKFGEVDKAIEYLKVGIDKVLSNLKLQDENSDENSDENICSLVDFVESLTNVLIEFEKLEQGENYFKDKFNDIPKPSTNNEVDVSNIFICGIVRLQAEKDISQLDYVGQHRNLQLVDGISCTSNFSKKIQRDLSYFCDPNYVSFYLNRKKLIKKLKCKENDMITHYTSLDVAKILMFGDGVFRLYEGTYMNDKVEGDLFYNIIGINPNNINSFNITDVEYSPKLFISSFTRGNNSDKLLMWRLYGRDAVREANGVSLTVGMKEFERQIILKKGFFSFLSTYSSSEEGIYNVMYYDSDNNLGKVRVPGFSQEDNDGLSEAFNMMVDSLRGLYNSSGNMTKEQATDKLEWQRKRFSILKELEILGFLVKSEDFEYEQEVRLLFSGNNQKLIVDESSSKTYMELFSLKPYIKKVTLGPNIENQSYVASLFYYKTERHCNFNDSPTKIVVSKIPFK